MAVRDNELIARANSRVRRSRRMVCVFGNCWAQHDQSTAPQYSYQRRDYRPERYARPIHLFVMSGPAKLLRNRPAPARAQIRFILQVISARAYFASKMGVYWRSISRMVPIAQISRLRRHTVLLPFTSLVELAASRMRPAPLR
jgi:hypothetical protein